ncbi:MAG: NADPH:quinone dehydrogenase [Cycloclasticus sp. symbiont of Bathymodiolus heckerae]|nr:MAG: NADPH:quinone dehydrogenase [Cycloclasticus sp. symbiont of Bathymodiolus heckerae]
MSDVFNAIVATDVDGKTKGQLQQLTLSDLPDEDVLIEVSYSSLNFKDGLAVSGKGRICKKLPMVCGIDLAGTVLESASDKFSVGDLVLVNGYGLGEKFWGGYSQKARINSNFIVKVPESFSLQDTMAIGTAGYTAMLCVMALEKQGVTPNDGEVLVTGAAGGVGSVAIAILSNLGYQVVASTGRPETHDYLSELGAASFIDRAELSEKGAPLAAERWAGVVDTVGSTTLANAIAQTKYNGCVAACGLAGGIDLPSTVFPFILRGITLAGVDSVMVDMDTRNEAWARLSTDLPKDKIRNISRLEPMSDLPALAEQIVTGQVRGRVVIDVNA